jgi:membrane protease YdiL (CAAX protease family)
LLASAALAAPLVEEILFRGILWRAVAVGLRGRAATIAPLVVTALLFGVWHLGSILAPSWIGTGGTSLAVHVAYGLFLGAVRIRTGGVGLGVLLHGLGNAWWALTG